MIPLPAAPDAQAADELLADLRGRPGLAFADYQRASLLRRIARRMQLAGAADVAAYRALLAADPAEYGRLCEAVPVHRTGFFRDPAVWAFLAAGVVPGILAGKGPGEPVRAWSAGCATGEEAYSLAILLAEALGPDALADGRLKVSATDVSGPVVERARAGRYRAASLAAVPGDLRERYFRPAESGWLEVRPELRRRVVFARHDLLTDFPLGRMDLVACRNTLMYFSPEAQPRCLAGLYLAVRPGGALVTGPAEDPTVWSDLFRPASGRHHVYRPAAGGAGEALLRFVRRPPTPAGLTS